MPGSRNGEPPGADGRGSRPFAPDTLGAADMARSLLAYLPSSRSDGTICGVTNDDPNRSTDVNVTSDDYDMRHVIAELADHGEFF